MTGGTPTTLAYMEDTTDSLTLSANGSTLYGAEGNTIFSIPVTGGTPTALATLASADDGSSSLTLSADGQLFMGPPKVAGRTAAAPFSAFRRPAARPQPWVRSRKRTETENCPLSGSLTLIGSTLFGMTD